MGFKPKSLLQAACLLLTLAGLAGTGLGAQTVDQDIQVVPIPGLSADFIRGVDISMLAQIEEAGGVYFDRQGKKRDLLEILKDNGVNWVRLRLWNDPVNHQPVIEGGKVISNKGQRAGGGNNDLDRTIALALRAKKAGMKFLLDFHYSDFWTDPGKQYKPEAWKDLTGTGLQTALRNYTKETLLALDKAGVWPDMVQTGNEVNNGMLWPDGKIWAGANGEKVGGIEGFTALMSAAIQGVRDAQGSHSRLPVSVHLAEGGSNGAFRSVFDPFSKAGMDYDIIGLSYYPYWHGSLENFRANLRDLASRYGKPLVVMETAYGFTTEDGDDFGNVFKVFNTDTYGYLPSVQGQASLVRDVLAEMAAIPGNKGLGGFYWEPAWIPVPGAGWRTGEGCAWENQAMFDYQGRALASLEVFRRIYDKAQVKVSQVRTLPEEMTITLGDKFQLPAMVKAVDSDGVWRLAAVQWSKNPGEIPQKEGQATITGKLKDSGLAASIQLEFTFIKNLVPDPSFESGTLNGWSLSDPLKASLAESNQANAQSGNWTYKYWLDKPFQTILTRTFTGLANGNYVLKVASMGGGGEKSLRLFARGFGSDKTLSVSMSNSGWQKWKTWSIEIIPVSNSQCTIGIYIDALAGNWGNFDDVEFYLDRK